MGGAPALSEHAAAPGGGAPGASAGATAPPRDEAPAPARALVAAAAAAALGALAFALAIAAREWFSRDDFAFLAHVRIEEPWSWRAVFLPQAPRFWPFYRPLGMDAFFRLGFQAFGLRAFGYFALAIALHFASGALVHSLARRFGCGAAAAWVAAVLAVTRPASLVGLYYGAVFHYVAASFLSLAALELFLRDLSTRRASGRLAVCAAVAAALLCNEAAMALPAVLACGALAAGELRRRGPLALGRALAPACAVTALYAGFRFGALAPVERSDLYAPQLGAQLPPNALAIVAQAIGAAPELAGAALWTGGCLLAVALGRARSPHALAWLARVAGGCLAWATVAALPFALLPYPQARWSMLVEAPVCLGLAALLEAARRSLPSTRARSLDAWVAVALLAAVPWSALLARWRDPVGAAPRRLVEWIDAAGLPAAAPVVLLYGAPGLADTAQGERLRELSYGGGVLRAVDPSTRRVLRFFDLTRRAPRNVLRPDCIYVLLRPDGSLEPAGPDVLARVLDRGGTAAPGAGEDRSGAS